MSASYTYRRKQSTYTFSVQTEIQAITKNVVSIASTTPLSVPFNTPFASLDLPDFINVSLSDGTNQNMDVTWVQGSYNPAVASLYTVLGTLTLPAGVTNTGNIQASIMVNVSAQVNTPNGLGERISVQNLKKVWRIGTNESCTLSIPQNYTVDWAICDDRTHVAVATGTGTTVSYTPVDGQYSQVFYIRAVASKGPDLVFPFISKTFPIYPADFGPNDPGVIHWDASNFIQYRNDNYANRTGAKIYIDGEITTTGLPAFEKWRSTDKYHPCHFRFGPNFKNMTGNAYGMRVNRNCQNLLFDGVYENHDGVLFEMVPKTGETYGSTTRAQIIYVEAADTDTTQVAADASKNLTFGGFHLKGHGISSAGITWQTTNTPNINYDTYSLDGCNMHDFLIEDTNDEGIYIGRFTDALSPTRAYGPITNARFFRIKTINTGADGMQWGSCFNSVMYDLDITNAGYRSDPSHKNGISWNGGNKNCSVFNVKINSCKNGIAMHTGRGGGDCEFFNVILINPTINAVNWFLRIDENDYDKTLSYRLHHNTTWIAQGNSEEVWAATATPVIQTIMNPYISADNAFIQPDVSKYVVRFNNTPNTGWILNDYLTTNFNAFVSNSDFNPKDANSPLFRAKTPGVTTAHPWAAYDFDRVGYFKDCSNALGGHYLFT